jgi:DNA-binding HxlR family transcriptional regulator
VSGKWTLLIVRDLIDGPRFFTELESSLIGMSPRTLCDRLKLLMQHDLVSRTRINGVPPRSVYELTVRGHALIPIIDAMREAGETLRSLPMQLVGDDADAACCD